MTALKKYEPLMYARLKDGRDLVFKESDWPALKSAISQGAKFVEIEGVFVNSFEIVKIEKVNPDDLSFISGQLPGVRSSFDQRCREFKSRIGRDPTPSEKSKILSKILQNADT